MFVTLSPLRVLSQIQYCEVLLSKFIECLLTREIHDKKAYLGHNAVNLHSNV